jgi:hypothetical protein
MLRRLPAVVVLLALLANVHRDGGGLWHLVAMPAAMPLYLVPWAFIASVALSPALMILCMFWLWRWYVTGRPPAVLRLLWRWARRTRAARQLRRLAWAIRRRTT